MEPSTWERLEAVFFEALALDPEDRGAFIERACAGDDILRAEVEAVLASHLAMAGSEPEEVPPDRRVGTRVGAYRLEALIGRGGMGEVYRARRADDVYEQEVAVKIVRSGLPPAEMVRRFRLERQILARLEHPNVAALLDGGVTEGGQPYLVMQFVHGVPITDYVDRHRLPVADRLRLFVTACRAVQFAHANLVVHRDIKPSNILVTDDGRVRLLDFGIAKLIDPEGAGGTLPTESLLLLTPEHAAPEQFLGTPITTATDVYQLGVLLYELLTGERPFRAGSTLELHRAICEQEPARPSTVLGRSAAAGTEAGDTVATADAARVRSTTPSGLRRQLRGDLDRIVLKALRKEPERRYGSAAELADDVERHLEGYPVEARPESFGYVAGRFVRRHRLGVTAGLALAASMVALVVMSLRFASTKAAQSTAIAAERDVAVEISTFLENLFEASDPFNGGPARRDTLRIRDFFDEGVERVRTGLAGQPLVQARLLATFGKAYRNLGRFDEARPLLEDAVTIRLRELGPDSPELAASRTDLAQLHIGEGKYDVAEALLDSSVTVLARDSVAFARPLTSSLNVLGNLYQERGRFPEAEAMYRRSLAIAQAASEDDGHHAQHLSNLGTALARQAKLDEAEALLRQAVDAARVQFGNEHPTTAVMLNNLGNVLSDESKLDEAEAALREALAIRRARFEPPQPDLAVSVNNLGDLLLQKGDAAGAVALFQESLEMRKALYGERHPAVAIGLINVATAVARLDPGRRDEAVPLFEEAHAILLATVGPDHPLVGAVDSNFGRLEHDLGHHERALALLRDGLAVDRKRYDANHPRVLGGLSDIGRCLTDLARYAEAEAAFLEAYAGLEPQRDKQARVWDGLLVRMAALYRAMGREEEATRYEAMRTPGGP
jgi:serine/threonine-protein kinase